MIVELRRMHRFITTHPLSCRDPFAAWQRWFRWQIGSRALPFPIALPWIAGARLVVERGMTGATGNYYCGLHEFSDMALLLHYLGSAEQGEAVLDVGANIGSYTILASAVCGVPSLSLEPVPPTFERLMRNVALNNIGTLVDARCMAAGATRGNVEFTIDQDTTNQVAPLGYSGGRMEVPMVSLDELLAGRESIPSFWKVDVEGYESEVLAGALDSLMRPEVKIVLLEADNPTVAGVMNGSGFERHGYEPFSRTVCTPERTSGSANTIWLRSAAHVEARCRASRSYQIFGVTI